MQIYSERNFALVNEAHSEVSMQVILVNIKVFSLLAISVKLSSSPRTLREVNHFLLRPPLLSCQKTLLAAIICLFSKITLQPTVLQGKILTSGSFQHPPENLLPEGPPATSALGVERTTFDSCPYGSHLSLQNNTVTISVE